MSFILDALRKSEHDRQRAAMPGIAQVPFALPRRAVPRWAIALIVVLGVAVLALGGAWWRSASQDSTPDAASVAPRRAEIPLTLPPAEVSSPPAAVYSAPRAPERDAADVAAADTERLARPPPARRNDTAAASANGAATPATDAAEPAETEEPALPSAAALAAEGVTLPPLRLELHAYSPRPADRFVFINGTKYVEGATLAEGPRLQKIAPNGAVLVYLGHRFLLAPQ